MAEFSFVKPIHLQTQRLDSEYYSRKYVENAGKVERAERVVTLEEIRKRGAPIRRGIDMPHFVEDSVSPFMVTIASFDDPGIDFSQLKRVSRDQHESFRGSHIKDGDLLVAMGGYAGKAALCPINTPVCNIGRHTARIAVDPAVADERYIWSFIRSKIGILQFERYITGSVQAGINLEDIRAINISLPIQLAQKYIGNKVRQAELLRAWAKGLEVKVELYHQQFIPDQTSLEFGKKTRNVSTAKMTERLDAHFYPGVVDEYLRRHEGKFQPVRAITTAIYNGQTQPETTDAGCLQITVTNLSPTFIGDTPRNVLSPTNKNKFLQQHDILMCNAAHNKSYIGRDLTYVHSDTRLLPSTEVMTIRVDRSQVPASYVRTYLKTKLGFVQIQSTIRGITAHSYPSDVALLDIFIPEVPPDSLEEWFAQDKYLAQAGKAVEVATLLTSSAKLLVECFIEGFLTEQQLIDAQQALEAGDDSLDLAILAQLTTQGFNADIKAASDENSQPLFSDLDELYRLLEQAQEAMHG